MISPFGLCHNIFYHIAEHTSSPILKNMKYFSPPQGANFFVEKIKKGYPNG